MGSVRRRWEPINVVSRSSGLAFGERSKLGSFPSVLGGLVPSRSLAPHHRSERLGHSGRGPLHGQTVQSTQI
ncbi:hypothetical protein K474DRAFT_1670726 [Panus rudis PR-1116 ss-1]|nr:hypothetical protein K474DRAFT_1670726 [Panus rudis PR-1116 ss-1]